MNERLWQFHFIQQICAKFTKMGQKEQNESISHRDVCNHIIHICRIVSLDIKLIENAAVCVGEWTVSRRGMSHVGIE